MRRVFIIGAGHTKFGRSSVDALSLMLEASKKSMDAAQLSPSEIDQCFYSNAFGFAERQLHIGPLLNTALGIWDRPSITVESACSSGSAALYEAFINIASGNADVCLVAGGERLLHLKTNEATAYFAMGSDYALECANGATFPGLYALMASAHMRLYHTNEEMLASVAIKNHGNAVHNEYAHFRKSITMSDYMESPYVAYPLRLYDCCPFSDGAAAVILSSEEFARKRVQELVEIVACRRAGGYGSLTQSRDLTSLPAARNATASAFNAAHLTPGDVDVAEVHDCFTIAEIVATEDTGLFPPGSGGKAALEGDTAIGGRIAVNPSGGLKAKGHPVSATGVSQIYELYNQLTENSGKRQVAGAEIGMAHNVGATGGSCTVTLLRRVR